MPNKTKIYLFIKHLGKYVKIVKNIMENILKSVTGKTNKVKNKLDQSSI